jgi:hypothetical protein
VPRRPQIARRAPDRTSTAPSAQSEVNFRLTQSKRTPVDRAQRASKLRSRVAQLQRTPLVLNRAAQAADLRLSDTLSQPLAVERAQQASGLRLCPTYNKLHVHDSDTTFQRR